MRGGSESSVRKEGPGTAATGGGGGGGGGGRRRRRRTFRRGEESINRHHFYAPFWALRSHLRSSVTESSMAKD